LPANRDGGGRFSVRVDEGIYLWSAGGEALARSMDFRRWVWVAWLGGILGLLAAAIAVAAREARRSPRRIRSVLASLAVLGLGSVMGVLANPATHVTCYAPMPLFSEGHQRLVARQCELLEKYRAAGVITQETYGKALYALSRAAGD
jgi:hypothetical protein